MNDISSFYLQTALQFRTDLPDSAFRIRFQEGAVNRHLTFTTRFAYFASFPVLAGKNMPSGLTQVFVKRGMACLPHSHPCSFEMIYVLNGVFRVLITFEGTDAGVVTIDVNGEEATAFPQGLI